MADTIELVVSPNQIQAYLQQKRATLVDMLAQRMDFVNNLFAERVRGNLDGGVLKQKTGALLSTVHQEPAVISGNEMVSAVTAGGPSAPYGVFFEEGGTGYYEIKPINARVLAFLGEGGMIFAKVVNHPPTPKLPWFSIEVPTAQQEMNDGLNQAIRDVLET